VEDFAEEVARQEKVTRRYLLALLAAPTLRSACEYVDPASALSVVGQYLHDDEDVLAFCRRAASDVQGITLTGELETPFVERFEILSEDLGQVEVEFGVFDLLIRSVLQTITNDGVIVDASAPFNRYAVAQLLLAEPDAVPWATGPKALADWLDVIPVILWEPNLDGSHEARSVSDHVAMSDRRFRNVLREELAEGPAPATPTAGPGRPRGSLEVEALVKTRHEYPSAAQADVRRMGSPANRYFCKLRDKPPESIPRSSMSDWWRRANEVLSE
jgi:hypothetical protein